MNTPSFTHSTGGAETRHPRKALGWRDVVDKELPDTSVITSEMREDTIDNSSRFRGSVRLAMGLFFTTEEYERKRKRILETPLP